jgi:hypothetical protein
MATGEYVRRPCAAARVSPHWCYELLREMYEKEVACVVNKLSLMKGKRLLAKKAGISWGGPASEFLTSF